MKITEGAEKIMGLIVAGGSQAANREIQGGYVSDLLSDVMAHSNEGDIWVTLQKHVNILAVAQLKGLAGIVLVNGRKPDEATAARAEQEQIPIISTELSAFDVAGILYCLGIRGRRSA